MKGNELDYNLTAMKVFVCLKKSVSLVFSTETIFSALFDFIKTLVTTTYIHRNQLLFLAPFVC